VNERARGEREDRRTRPSVVGTKRRSPSLPTGCLCNCQIITIGGNFSRVDIDCGILLIIGTGRFRARPDDDGTVVAAFQPPALFHPTLLLRPVSFRFRKHTGGEIIGGIGGIGAVALLDSPFPAPLRASDEFNVPTILCDR